MIEFKDNWIRFAAINAGVGQQIFVKTRKIR